MICTETYFFPLNLWCLRAFGDVLPLSTGFKINSNESDQTVLIFIFWTCYIFIHFCCCCKMLILMGYLVNKIAYINIIIKEAKKGHNIQNLRIFSSPNFDVVLFIGLIVFDGNYMIWLSFRDKPNRKRLTWSAKCQTDGFN